MTSESGTGGGPAFCGNCGAAMTAGIQICGACGRPAAADAAPMTADVPPPDYIPYCRNCGIGVPWGAGHTCRRCGVTPLCQRHFRSAAGLCLDCAAATSVADYGGGLRCRICAAAVSPNAGFCPNCGQVATAAPREGVEYMGFWIRFAAFAVDWIIVYVAAALTAAVIGVSLTSGDVDPAALDDISIALENFNYSFLLLFCGMSSFYGAVMTVWRGQTLGKMLLRIQVVDADGNVPPWPRALLRELARGVILLALLTLVIYVWVALDARKRGPQDYLGGSYVVRKQRSPNQPGGEYN